MPKGKTAKDVIDYERNELGNKDVVPTGGADLSKLKSEHLTWVTGSKRSTQRYGKVSQVDTGGHSVQVIAKDGDGGMLIHPQHVLSKRIVC